MTTTRPTWDEAFDAAESGRWGTLAELKSIACEALVRSYRADGIEDGIGSSDVNHVLYPALAEALQYDYTKEQLLSRITESAW